MNTGRDKLNLHQQIHAQLLRLLQHDPPSEAGLNNALRLLAKYRSTLIQNTLVQQQGTKIMDGPFAGMEFIEHSAEGCHLPKLLGCYEEELHPFLSSLPAMKYSTVLKIGCAEGYYAVGIKRLLPAARMIAFDINPAAQAACKALAGRNGVAVEVRGICTREDFNAFSSADRMLVWCDIEGAEGELLDPQVSPALRQMDLVVEFHPVATGHTFNDVLPRFTETHAIEILQTSAHHPLLPPFLKQLGHLDQLLAQWEWRSGPTPWAVMRANKRIAVK